jgi:DNA mismatch repair protein MutL
MSSIRILPDQVANRIAAGEVIERPVAVVKELVDNSIDAGADHIKVQFKQGGKSYILVEDNGQGMSRDDALLCIERHATSKIRSSDDLFNIQTLGFRGEAIPSIASVSRFLLRTRREDSLEGTEILINGGKLIHRKDVGLPPGTRIEVTHLFSSIPARRKFLKTDNTEASHIIQWIRLMALAHPQVAFRLQSNQRTLITLPGHQPLLERILSLWGKELESQLQTFDFKTEGITGTGYIGKAGVSRPSRQDIVTIVNGRPVESRTLGFAFTEAYHTHIPKGRYPIVFLDLRIEPSMIDVNIHPSKKEIKFKNESLIRTLVIQGVWAVLRQKPEFPQSPVIKTPGTEPILPKITVPEGISEAIDKGSSAPVGVPVQTPKTTFAVQPVVSSADSGTRFPEPSPTTKPPASEKSAANHSTTSRTLVEKEWRFVGDYARSYSIYERPGGLTLVHNTRALRRIQFERILNSLSELSSTIQRDIVPVSFELDVHLSNKLKKLLPLLLKCSIHVVEFGRNFYRIEEVPSFMDGESARQFVMDWLHGSDESATDLNRMRSQLALLCSSRDLQTASLPLNRDSAQHVLKQLLDCNQPMVDPEGKPVIHHLPHRFFENSKGLETIL